MLRALTLLAATTRLTTLITQDQLTAPLRNHIQTHALAHPDSLSARLNLPYLIQCNRCVSVYAAAATLALYSHPRTRPVPKLLALSQLAITALDLLTLISPPPPDQPDLDLTLPDD